MLCQSSKIARYPLPPSNVGTIVAIFCNIILPLNNGQEDQGMLLHGKSPNIFVQDCRHGRRKQGGRGSLGVVKHGRWTHWPPQ